ncbi:MAG: hypothetical protein MNPFHGCM_00490 [Gemmatimonadaceae bacterium]|nr:hypothetical protein [Gemmatimonadaceae bacterium]
MRGQALACGFVCRQVLSSSMSSCMRRVAPRTRLAVRHALVLCLVVSAACGSPRSGEDAGTLIVYNAGSLALPLRTALDSFAAQVPVVAQQENAGSLETARKLTELHRIPDIVAVADYEVIPALLMPDHATWYAKFARNRMVVAYTDRSRGAADIAPENWWQVLTRPGVEVGRSEPSLDPNGYRTLLVWQLAEKFYGQPGLYSRLEASAPPANVRPKEADLVGLLQAGQFDYIWSYQSIAKSAGLRWVELPSAIDLSAPEDSAQYAVASTRVAGRTPKDSLTIRGQPIVYAFTIPSDAPHPELAMRFARYLLSADGQRVLRGARLDALDPPILVGPGIPAGLR